MDNLMKIYAVKNASGITVPKYGTSNPYYSRKSDAVNRANRLNESRHNTAGPYEAVEGVVLWSVPGFDAKQVAKALFSVRQNKLDLFL